MGGSTAKIRGEVHEESEGRRRRPGPREEDKNETGSMVGRMEGICRTTHPSGGESGLIFRTCSKPRPSKTLAKSRQRGKKKTLHREGGRGGYKKGREKLQSILGKKGRQPAR